ncbi:MAG: hypothetical protein ORN23_07510 [Chthoniobacterales bacterium]|jgi:hypothetical protein|nr:hypothetical protein [Chthoniobacterales bacterium]
MKTTLELPDNLLRKVKSSVASSGKTMKAFMIDAIQDKLAAQEAAASKPWLMHFGVLRHLGGERQVIEAKIREEFDGVDSNQWK